MSVYFCRAGSHAETDSDERYSVGFKMRAGAKLIVEARSGESAAEMFALVRRRAPGLKGKTAKLAPNLFFAQAEVTGNYFIFTCGSGRGRHMADS